MPPKEPLLPQAHPNQASTLKSSTIPVASFGSSKYFQIIYSTSSTVPIASTLKQHIKHLGINSYAEHNGDERMYWNCCTERQCQGAHLISTKAALLKSLTVLLQPRPDQGGQGGPAIKKSAGPTTSPKDTLLTLPCLPRCKLLAISAKLIPQLLRNLSK